MGFNSGFQFHEDKTKLSVNVMKISLEVKLMKVLWKQLTGYGWTYNKENNIGK